MKFDNMRSGHARCPPYLLIGLLLITILLLCNWWSLATQNYELLKQMDDMAEQLNVCSDDRVVCLSRRNTAETQLREAESKSTISNSKFEGEIKKLKTDIADYKDRGDKAKQDAEICTTELESLKKVDESRMTTLASLRLEKETLLGQLNDAKDKIKELESSDKIKSKVVSADTAQIPLVKTSSAAMPKYTASPAVSKKDKLPEEVLPFPNDGPVNDANHDIENVLENAANEEQDDGMPDADVMKKPPVISY